MPREIETIVYEYENIYTGETFETEEEAIQSEKEYLEKQGNILAYNKDAVKVLNPYGLINIWKTACGLGEIEVITFENLKCLETFNEVIDERERKEGCDSSYLFEYEEDSNFPLTFVKNSRWKENDEFHGVAVFISVEQEKKRLESQLKKIENLLDKISKQ